MKNVNTAAVQSNMERSRPVPEHSSSCALYGFERLKRESMKNCMRISHASYHGLSFQAPGFNPYI